MEFAGLTCLVTGGSKGIGGACVELFASKGARVFACARKQDVLDKLISSLKSKGYDVQGCACDVTDPEAVKTMMQQVSEAFEGKLNVLVNNAGGLLYKSFMESEKKDFDYIMDINVRSVVNVCQAAHPLLKASNGASVVNIGSIAGTNRAMEGMCHYSLSKSALDMLTKTLSCEWVTDKIRVNCVAPGLVDTEMTTFMTESPDVMNMHATETPMKRPGQPKEIAGVIAFFASGVASYITGQTLFVDGGYMVRGMGY